MLTFTIFRSVIKKQIKKYEWFRPRVCLFKFFFFKSSNTFAIRKLIFSQFKKKISEKLQKKFWNNLALQ